MASKPRNYKPNTPYLVTQRFGNGVRWLDSATLRALLIRLVIFAAARADVLVLAFFIVGNHVHFVLGQRIAGARNRTQGIAAFMRNVFAVFCRVVVLRHVKQKRGHVVQRRYDHQELSSGADLMRALAYVHGQQSHHRIRHLEDLLSRTSWGAVVAQDPDGVVTDIVEHGLDPEQLEALLTGTIQRACEAERLPDSEPFAWRTALEQTGAELTARGVLTDRQRTRLCGAGPCPTAAEWGDPASLAHARRRQARLEAGIIGRHFLLMQGLDDEGHVVSVMAFRGRPTEGQMQYHPAGFWGVETIIDYRAQLDPSPPPQTE